MEAWSGIKQGLKPKALERSIEGEVDYNQTFSQVVKTATIRSVISIFTKEKLPLSFKEI